MKDVAAQACSHMIEGKAIALPFAAPHAATLLLAVEMGYQELADSASSWAQIQEQKFGQRLSHQPRPAAACSHATLVEALLAAESPA